MKANLNGRNIEIDIRSLLRDMEGEQKRELVDVLSCEDAIISHVMTQVMDGLTEGENCGYEDASANPKPHCPLSVFQREIARRSSDVAEREIGRLERALKVAQDDAQKYSDLYYAIVNKNR